VSEPTAHTPSQRRPNRAALVLAAILVVLAAVIVWDMSRLNAVASYARIGPQTIPYAIAIGLAALGLWSAIEAFRDDFPQAEPQEFAPMGWIVAGLLIQLAIIRFAGFSIASGIMFGMVARGFGYRRLWIAIPAGIVISAFVWLLFARGLSLTLPAGPLEHVLGDGLGAVFSLFAGRPPGA
jgi:putative tricarboxylic transport membrane protein